VPARDFINAILADKPEDLQDDNFVNKLYDEIHKDKHPRKTLKMV